MIDDNEVEVLNEAHAFTRLNKLNEIINEKDTEIERLKMMIKFLRMNMAEVSRISIRADQLLIKTIESGLLDDEELFSEIYEYLEIINPSPMGE